MESSKQSPEPLTTMRARYGILGALIGLLFPLAGLMIEAFAAGAPVDGKLIAGLHTTHPIMWLMDVAPLLLGGMFYLLGHQQDQLRRLSADLDRQLAQRSAELGLANQRLTQEMEVMHQIEVVVEQGKKEWEAIFDSVSDLIFLVDADGMVMRCNRAVVDTFHTPFP
ncbi:MAG: PAS domain-containing protein, partial [Chloroflexota bacterium]